MEFELRPFHPTDLEKVVQLFTETVHGINSRDYSPRQIAVWAPKKPDLIRWASRFAGSECLLAVSKNGKDGKDGKSPKDGRNTKGGIYGKADKNEELLGFGNLVDYSYMDFLYVHKDHQSKGIATTILQEIEGIARRWGSSVISLNASKNAKPFFEHHSYEVIRQQEVHREGIAMINFHMRKRI